MKHLTIVLGTAREGRESEKVAQILTAAFMARQEFEVTYVDVKDHVTMPKTVRRKDAHDATFASWQHIAARTGTFIFVIPEYHRGYPGEWKLLIDSLEEEYREKTAYIVGVSSGIFAGVRMGEHIKTVLVELGFSLNRTAFFVGNVETAFTPEGTFKDEAVTARLSKFVEDITKREVTPIV